MGQYKQWHIDLMDTTWDNVDNAMLTWWIAHGAIQTMFC